MNVGLGVESHGDSRFSLSRLHASKRDWVNGHVRTGYPTMGLDQLDSWRSEPRFAPEGLTLLRR